MNSVMRAWSDLPPIYADRLMALLAAPDRPASGLHAVNQLLLDADRFCAPHWLRPVRWAVLYHDAIRDPGADPIANAVSSAELWREHFPAIHETVRGVSGQWEQEVAAVILNGADPFARDPDLLPWQHAGLDLTLGPLGLPPLLYEARRLLTVAEAGGIRRRAFLEQAMACPRLYHRIFLDREDAARENMRRELETSR